MKNALIVMAAGFGRRFRQAGCGQKLLAMLEGKPVLQHTLEQARATGSDVYVVAQTCDAAIHRLAGGSSVIRCDSKGLGDSIAAGVKACEAYDGWLIALGDMPWLCTASYLAVLEALSTSPVVRPVIGGVHGHPVGFQRRFYPALTALNGDGGASAILQQHPARLVPLEDQGCLLDVDVPQALLMRKAL